MERPADTRTDLDQGFKIRKARGDEFAAIKRMSAEQTFLELDEFEWQDRESIKRDHLERLDLFFKRPGNEFYVVEAKDGKMAGYVWFGVSERPFSGTKVGWVYEIEVVPEYRRRGIGEVLLRHALKVSKERGFSQTGLMVNQKNKVASSLYEKVGFQTEFRLMSRRN